MLAAALAGAHTLLDPHHRVQRRRSKSEITIPNRASATDASLQGTLRANKRRGGGEAKARNTAARERNLIITITQNQSSLGGANENFVILSAGEGEVAWAEG
jgi:hypothetical protein